MRTTLDIPDHLFRRLKSRAAIEGLSLKDLLARYVTTGLQRAESPEGGQVSDGVAAVAHYVSAWDVMQDGSGIARSGHRDLATNPAHLDGFGRD